MAAQIPHVLVVDDHDDMLVFLRKCLNQEGYNVSTCSSGFQAIDLLKNTEDTSSGMGPIDAILSDVRMPQLDGLALLKKVQEIPLEIPVVLMTAFGTVEDAVKAIKAGAYDYLTKPFKLEDVRQTMKRALEFRRETEDSLSPAEVVVNDRGPVSNPGPQSNKFKSEPTHPHQLIGHSSRMKEIYRLIGKLSNVQSNVLVLGESGSGKEMIAQAIHRTGKLASKPFVAINCAAIPEELLESELFGHAKGSFTGATNQKAGLFEEADGGTLFLDEIGDMPLSLQAKLLRVLQERKIRAVGSNTFKDINVRVIAATHRDLRTAIREGDFREDLFYRLSVVPIAIPPLRDRKEDIPLFVDHFLKKFVPRINSPVTGVSPEALSILCNFKWEGNIRQLENAIERALILSRGPLLEVQDISFLEDHLAIEAEGESRDIVAPGSSLNMRDVEKKAVILALEKSGGKKEVAAQMLGISRKTLYRKEKEFGLA